MLVINSKIQIPESEFSFTYVRSSGPGGQNVNKVNSKAVLRWNAVASPSLPDEVRARLLATHAGRVTSEGDLIVTSQRFRDQGRNAADALDKLREIIARATIRPKKRRATKPSRAAVRRRLESKQAHSRTKQRRQKPGDE
jgi:ribosome-associated protein